MRRCLMSSASAGTAEPQTLTATAGTIISKYRGADIAFNDDTVPLAEPGEEMLLLGIDLLFRRERSRQKCDFCFMALVRISHSKQPAGDGRCKQTHFGV